MFTVILWSYSAIPTLESWLFNCLVISNNLDRHYFLSVIVSLSSYKLMLLPLVTLSSHQIFYWSLFLLPFMFQGFELFSILYLHNVLQKYLGFCFIISMSIEQSVFTSIEYWLVQFLWSKVLSIIFSRQLKYVFFL